MIESNLQHCKEEYESKKALAATMEQYYIDRRKELNLDGFDRIGAYLKDKLGEYGYLVDRGIIFSHLDFDKISSLIFLGRVRS